MKKIGNPNHQINRYSAISSTNRLSQLPLSNNALALDENFDSLSPLANHNMLYNENQPVPHVHVHQQSKQLNSELNLSFNLIENDIKEIRDYLRHTKKKLETTDSKTKHTKEWKQVALVLDRTLFYLYILANIVSFSVMFNK